MNNIKVTKTERIVEETIKIEMSKEDAMILQTVLFHIGGNQKGPRGRMEALSKGLKESGVKFDRTPISCSYDYPVTVDGNLTLSEASY